MGISTLVRGDFRRYGVAVISVVFAISAAYALRPLMGQNFSPVVLSPWIALAAWHGLGVGLASTALSALAAAYFLIPPIYSFRVAERSDWMHLAAFALQGVLISWLCESRRRAVIARTAAVREAQQAHADARARSQALAQANLNLRHITGALVESDAERISLLAERLGCYARLASMPRRPECIDVQCLVAQAVAGFDEITCDLAPIQIKGDPSQLLTVFHNLIDNAIKFQSGEAPRIRISAEVRGGQCVFAVADNGIGIVPARWDAAFALGSRMNGGRYPGAGMGLPIAKRIVENQGGRIWLNSECGRGTTVRFTMPIRSV